MIMLCHAVMAREESGEFRTGTDHLIVTATNTERRVWIVKQRTQLRRDLLPDLKMDRQVRDSTSGKIAAQWVRKSSLAKAVVENFGCAHYAVFSC